MNDNMNDIMIDIANNNYFEKEKCKLELANVTKNNALNKNGQHFITIKKKPDIFNDSVLPEYLSFEYVPEEILLLIFSKITYRDTFSNVRQCCKRFHDLIGYNFASTENIINHAHKSDSIELLEIAEIKGEKMTNKNVIECVKNDSVECLKYLYTKCVFNELIWLYIVNNKSIKCCEFLKEIKFPDDYGWAVKYDISGEFKKIMNI